MNRVYLVRHADAGDRAGWTAPDDLRPLSEKGWVQARGLVEQMAGDSFDLITSSPSLRCVQTVLPLSEERGIHVEQDPRLLEGHDSSDTFTWLERLVVTRSLVACTHGDIVPAILDRVAATRGSLPADRWAKGSTWVLSHDGTRWGRGEYRKAPG